MLQLRTSYNFQNKIWTGAPEEVKIDETKSLGEAIFEGLDDEPNNICQINADNEVCLTKAEIKLNSLKIATHLKHIGLRPGDIVSLIARNTDHIAATVFGAVISGIQISTLDPSFRFEEINAILKLTQPKFIFADSDKCNLIKTVLKNLNLNSTISTVKGRVSGIISVDDILKSVSQKAVENFETYKTKNATKEIAFILCTSGTTGIPKAVTVSHAQLTTPFAKTYSIRTLCFSTLFWISGLYNLLMTTFNDGIRIITSQEFTPEHMFQIIERYKVNTLVTHPRVMILAIHSPAIENYDLSSILSYTCGGAPVPTKVTERMQKYMPHGIITTMFGCSESTPDGTFSFPYNGTAGQLLPDISAKIIDKDGNRMGINEAGEICLKNKFPFLGYYKQPDKTEEILDEDGFIHTGDLGYFDENGDLNVIDRITDKITCMGYHYYPNEIEDVIRREFDIVEVCVVRLNNPAFFHVPAALIVKKATSKVTEEDVINYIRKNLPDFKQLRGGVYFVNEIPVTPSGKYRRREAQIIVRDLFEKNIKHKL